MAEPLLGDKATTDAVTSNTDPAAAAAAQAAAAAKATEDAAALALNGTKSPEVLAAEKAAADKVAADAKTAADAKAAEEKAKADAAKTPEQKAAEEKAAAEAKAKADEEAKKNAVPEKYADFKLPDGMTFDKAALEVFLPLAKELKLTQEGAQKLIDFRVSEIQKAVDSQKAAMNAVIDGWVEQGRTDKEIGGAKYDETVTHARAFVKAFGSPAFLKAMNETGMEFHPEVLRVFSKAGKLVVEDKVHFGGPNNAPVKSQAERMFPNLPPN